jgi:DUF4097 and DUF4098 domain-containing protein YvlB
MRVIHTSVFTVAAVVIACGSASAQERSRPRGLEESIERSAEALAKIVERGAERWAKDVERWADEIERNAGRWAEDIERNAERLAERIEARVEAADQGPETARERAQRQRDAQREREQRLRDAQREREQRQRDTQRERGNQGRGNTRDWPEATDVFSRTVRLDRTGIVDIENIAGDITITGGSGTDVRIDAIKRMKNPDEAQARVLLQQLQIEVTERPGRVEIRTVHPRARNSRGEVAYTLAVPTGADLVVKSVSGDLRVSNIKGELRSETINGNLTATAVSRIQSVKTVSGDIDITGAEGDITAGSINGDLILRSVKARSATLETISGDVRTVDVELERANIGSVNGDIDYVGRLARSGRYELHTHSGDIRITPVNTSGFELEASTFNGDVVSEYVMKTSTPLARSFAARRGGGNTATRGSYGDAGAVLALRSFNGDITVVKR